MPTKYPLLSIDLEKIRENAKVITSQCHKLGIEVVGVTKGFSCIPEVVQAMVDGGIDVIGDSRLDNLKKISHFSLMKMLLRVPMQDELEDVLTYSDYSLHSEISTIEKLEELAKQRREYHNIIIMVDLGDLREGIFDEEELVTIVKRVLEFHAIKLAGLGTNMKCYGGVIPTPENLNKLVEQKEKLEKKFHISLPIVSGGNSSAFSLVENHMIPNGITQLRLGESIILGNERAYFEPINGTTNDAFILKAQIVEIKQKPSIPIGIIGNTTVNFKPEFIDKGNQLRIICAIGKQDIHPENLFPIDQKIEILGGSSDYLIIDATHSNNHYDVGDILEFRLSYYGIVQLTTSKYVSHEIK